ncbi:unnamed protein product [Dibothriocephalus latus]|uniref:G-protein coupled receptors family 1 profile domain-containing protein n=1 Tax=Dibothriocephalus latus TaxID=60516 RepID=A0A3P7P5P6_DIBLA|nr:unnamed protein product [Dibothriocephalus latus]
MMAVGGVGALLALPTVVFGVLGELALLAAFSNKLVRSARQHIFSAYQCVFGIAFLIYFGINNLFLTKGLLWLGYEPIFLEYSHTYACKTSRFLKCFISATVSNILYADAINRAMAIKAKCYQPVTTTKCFVLLCCCVIGGFVAAVPNFIISNIWLIDGRYICGKDPAWSQSTVLWTTVHETLFANGCAQALSVLFLIMAMSRDVGKLDNTIDYLHTAHKLPGTLTETVFQVTFLLREARRDAWVCIIFNMSLAILMFVRGVIRGFLDWEIYSKFEDNGRTDGVLSFYMIIALEDLVIYLMMIVFAYHFWLFFFYVPAFRTWIFGETKDTVGGLRRKLEPFLPINPDEEYYQENWDAGTFYLQNGNPVLYQRMVQLDKIINEAQREVSRPTGGTDELRISQIDRKKKK